MRSAQSSLQSLKTTVAPAIEPITRDEVKNWLRISWADDDLLLDYLISSAREWLESRTSRALITQTLQGVWMLPKSPESKLRGIYAPLGMELTFWLPRSTPGGVTVTTAEIEKDLDVWQTMTVTTDYVVDADNDPPRVWLRASAISYWAPTGALINFMGVYAPRVRITWQAGYGAGQSAVPYSFRRALLTAVAYLYEHRDESGMPPDSLLAGLDGVRNV
ncbi:MAG: phage head-tail connector protein [Rhodospirillales bacterium]|nr:phage head-tail connector protein [Rhodospirillales bacterium]